MKKQFLLSALIAIVLLTKINYAQPLVFAQHDIYNPGDTISAVFGNGLGNPSDWIGIYKPGDVPGNVDAIMYWYVNNTTTPGIAYTEGVVTFTQGLAEEGDYWVGFFENDGYNLLAADSFKVKANQPFISINKYKYDIAEPITINFKNGPNNAADWVGIYKVGDTPGPVPSTLWWYVNGTQSATDGISSGTLLFDPGIVENGNWWAGFFENDGYTLLDSVGFVVSNLSDSISPAAPGSVNVIPGEFYDLVTWVDVPNEFFESYNVYVSSNPITDVDAEGVELIGVNINEEAQVFEHVLRSAKVDKERSYYYAVVCRDLAGNVGDLGTVGPITNTAKGIPTISINPPTPFEANGDLSEWEGIAPFVLSEDSGTANVPGNHVVDGDADLSAEVKIAVDNDNLYVMMEVTDDFYYHPMELNSWERDEPDLYIGLYNMTKAHVDYGTGKTADYQIRFDEDRIRLDAASDDSLLIPVGENYFHELRFPTGYLFEARIPLSVLETKRQDGQTANDTIEWKIGDKVPFTIGINDNDDGLAREGLIFYSRQVTEAAWNDVSSWTYTWISDEVVGVDDNPAVVNVYHLSQNYPNPFNPSTNFKFNIAEAGLVTLKIYDILGKEVATVVNEEMNPGAYDIKYDARNLSSGVYFYTLNAGSYRSTMKMILLK